MELLFYERRHSLQDLGTLSATMLMPGFPFVKLSLGTSPPCSAKAALSLLTCPGCMLSQALCFASLFVITYALKWCLFHLPMQWKVPTQKPEYFTSLVSHLPTSLLLLSSVFYKVLKYEHHSAKLFVTINEDDLFCLLQCPALCFYWMPHENDLSVHISIRTLIIITSAVSENNHKQS